MSDKLKRFEESVRSADNAPLIDSLIDHAKKADDNIEYYEAVKIIRKELLARLDPVVEHEQVTDAISERWKALTGRDLPEIKD